jgi:hypothetical protein
MLDGSEYQSILFLMNEKEIEIERIKEEWKALDSARRIYLAAERCHHEFDTEEEMKESMRHSWNPFDTFSVKNKGKK